MTRINLQVPFSQKDEAKALGARWDPVQKTWYISTEMNPDPFMCWLPQSQPISNLDYPEYSVRAPHYFIIKSQTGCWRCKEITSVFSFLLPPEYEYYESDAEDIGYWISPGVFSITSMVDGLAVSVISHMQKMTKKYRIAYSKKAGVRYYMNHCEHCNATQGDFYLHNEPGGAFFPTDQWDAQRISIYPVDSPFMGNCDLGFHSEDYFYESMRIIEFF